MSIFFMATPKKQKSVRIPKIVITGPPGAGKSSVLAFFEKEKKSIVQCVPEGATMAIEGLRITPNSPSDHLTQSDVFQHMLYVMQGLFENVCTEIARNENKKVLILEKGYPDIAPHLDGGTKTYEKLFKTTLKKDRAKYDCVIFLELAPKSAYELACKKKPSRRENYKQAKILEEEVRNVWKDHPHFVSIPSQATWEKKMKAIRQVIEDFLTSYN